MGLQILHILMAFGAFPRVYANCLDNHNKDDFINELFHNISLSSSFLPHFHLKTIFLPNVVEKLTFIPFLEIDLFELFETCKSGKNHHLC